MTLPFRFARVPSKMPLLLSLLFSFQLFAAVFDAGSIGTVSCSTFHPRLSYWFRPGCSNVEVQAGVRYNISFNKLGIRDRDFSAFPENGAFRILITGPSGLVGPGLELDETPIKILEQKLKKLNPRIEVINASTIGYHALFNTMRLWEYMEAYHPNLVVHFLSPTVDFTHDAIMIKNTIPDARGFPIRVDFSSQPKIPLWFPQFFQKFLLRLWSTIQFQGKRYAISRMPLPIDSQIVSHPLLQPEFFLLKSMRSLTNFKKTKFATLVLNLPITNKANLGPDQFYWLASLFDFFTPNISIPIDTFLSALSSEKIEYATIDPVQNNSIPGDYHLNQVGSHRLADLFYIQFKDKILSPTGATTPKKGN